MARNKRVRDMSNFEIRGELMKIGKSLSQLGIENGLAKTTVRNALDKPYPKSEDLGRWEGYYTMLEGIRVWWRQAAIH
ncbi:helix-turn-helix domain-containing protein [Mannheimia haemolytica]|uniref:helix-turn-helix domain-containing protein n=1 Tax=Mannheimia haemolytica TaxID=75985 RepID=UPI0011BECFB7|nr:helix-turn-helix domain-containing protein [Mannheimia haemolytica]